MSSDDSRQTTLSNRLAVSSEQAYGAPADEIADELQRWNLAPESIGRTVEEIPAAWAGNVYRWHFMYELWYYTVASSADRETDYAPIQFRTTLYTVGMPSENLTDHLREIVNPRQRTLYDTDEYEGYISGFGPFSEITTNTEGPIPVGIDRDELKDNPLGVPVVEVEVYDDSMDLRAEARGLAYPFTLLDHESPPAPQQERWDVTFNSARRKHGTYEFRPKGNAVTRLRGLHKTVSLNGRFIGHIYPSRGSVELANRYTSADRTQADSHGEYATGMQKWSRQAFIDADVFHPNAVRRGGVVWKVNETADHIALVATKPDDFEPTDPDEIDPGATGTTVRELALDADEPTEFDIRQESGLFGRFGVPETREIAEDTDWTADRVNYGGQNTHD